MKTWLRDIERATTEAEVIAGIRDYVCLWSPRELPEDCREISIEDRADIPLWKERLATGCARMRDNRPGADRLHDLVAYLARADERLGELREPARTL